MKKVLVILGPTATGKTDLAIKLAKRFNGELISCDSRQVYKGLDIGTGKMPGSDVGVKKGDGWWLVDDVIIHMYDVVDPKLNFTVKDYIQIVPSIVEQIQAKNKLPIIVGGTGFYLRGLLQGIDNIDLPVDEGLRNRLNTLSLELLQQELQKINPDRWNQMNNSDRANKRRLIRSFELSSNTVSKSISKGFLDKYDLIKVGLTLPKSELNQRIRDRLIKRINQGLIQEGEKLHKQGLSLQRMRELGLEYRSLADLIEEKIDTAKFIEELSIKIGQYAKRQITWFKREPDVIWVDIGNKEFEQKVEKRVTDWYNTADDSKN